MLPGFTEVGLTDLRVRVGNSEHWEYKVLPRWQAEAGIVRPAEAVGLRVELIDVETR